MAIHLKHGLNPGAALTASAGAEESNRRRISAERMAQTKLGHQHQLEALDQQHGNALDRMDASHENALERLDEQQQDRREDFEWEYSARQQKLYNQLDDAYEEAVQSGDYTPEELADIKRQVDAKKAGIQPVKRLRKSPYPKGQGVGQTWTSGDGSFIFTRDSHGNVKKVADTNSKPTYKDRMEAWKHAITLSEKDGVVDMGKARNYYREITGGWNNSHASAGEFQQVPLSSVSESRANSLTKKPEHIASDSRLSEQWDNSVKYVQEAESQIAKIQGNTPDLKRDMERKQGIIPRVEIDDIADLRTASDQLTNAKKALEKVLKDKPKRKPAGGLGAKRYYKNLRRWKARKQEAVDQIRKIKEKAAELRHKSDLLTARRRIMLSKLHHASKR